MGDEDGNDNGVEELHQPVNELEAFTMKMRKKMKKIKQRFRLGPAPPELSVEEKKVADMADIIKTYRHVDEDKAEDADDDEEWIDRPWFDIVMVIIILLNTVMIGLELDAEHDDGSPNSRHWGWIFIEVIFMLIFCFEVYIKIKYHTWIWILSDGWNFFYNCHSMYGGHRLYHSASSGSVRQIEDSLTPSCDWNNAPFARYQDLQIFEGAPPGHARAYWIIGYAHLDINPHYSVSVRQRGLHNLHSGAIGGL
jgi:hypothetical protein